jgi:hypothetical protein
MAMVPANPAVANSHFIRRLLALASMCAAPSRDCLRIPSRSPERQDLALAPSLYVYF